MIFYFSGTGNSQLVAKQIGKAIGDEVISINERMKTKETYTSKSPFVFVAPTYCWRLPRVVEQWILNQHFQGHREAYFILSCGGSVGNAGAYAKKLCEKMKFRFRGLAPVIMPENYVAMFATPDKEACRAIIEKALPEIKKLVEYIQKGKDLPKAAISVNDRLLSGPVNVVYYPLIVRDKGFHVTDKCISCGKCAKRCPLDNIRMTDKKPVWLGNCTHCMACIGGCPVEAIEYKSKSQGKPRYYIMEE